MAYDKLNFKNREVERPRTYSVTENGDGTITLRDSYGEIYQEGTPLDAENMNYLEDGIASCGVTKYSSSTIFSKNEIALDTDTGKIYLSLLDNNKNQALSNATYWKLLVIGTLETPRKINGTDFDGSKNITTSSWGTARNISISSSDGSGVGATTSVNGSAAVTLKLPQTIKADLQGNAETTTKATNVINVKDNSNIKFWTGTEAEYNAIYAKDASTLYNITDDTQDVTLTLLQTLYPVGALYLTTANACPLAALFGTWEMVSSGRVLQGADSYHEAGTTKEAGLPNITAGPFIWRTGTDRDNQIYGAMAVNRTVGNRADTEDACINGPLYTFDASRANPIYGNSVTVQPPAYLINVFRRSA